MNLEDFCLKDIDKDLLESKRLADFVNNFINELNECLEKDKGQNRTNLNKENKYNNYWQYQNFMEDNVAAIIGLSRWGADITYYDKLSKAVDDSILELSKIEGTLYRKQFSANEQFYNVDKFENGKITHIDIPKEKIPNNFQNEDIIFQYKDDGTINVRSDLKKQVVELASERSSKLIEEENKKNNEFKKEGHIYEAFEDDGYIFLNDLTEKKRFQYRRYRFYSR